MLVLALDTTTASGSVAVVRDSQTLALVKGDGSRTHGERLPGELEAALARAGVTVAALDLLVVATGPGAFTGLRIGLAAIQGLAMVLGKPVVGVSALDALADCVRRANPGSLHIATWMDAQRGEVFAARYSLQGVDDQMTGSAPVVGAPERILATLDLPVEHEVTFAGDGALRYRHLIARVRGQHARIVGPTPSLAPALASLAQQRAGEGAAGPPHALQPLYVRRPDAELDRERQANP